MPTMEGGISGMAEKIEIAIGGKCKNQQTMRYNQLELNTIN